MTNVKELSVTELHQRIKDATYELLAREIEEIRPLKTEDRAARLGEKIVITNAGASCGFYKNGDVFTVGGMNSTFTGVYARELHGDAPYISHREYEVIVEEEHDEYETCDSCNKKLEKLKSEDIYIEELDRVLCESCFDEATKSTNQQRAELIQRAREFWDENASDYFKYHVNEKDRTVFVWRVSPEDDGYNAITGLAVCPADDVFNVDIEKAIALARAFEIDIPEEFLDAVQPDEVVVGHLTLYEERQTVAKVIDKPCPLDGCVYRDNGRNAPVDGMIILDDTDAEYDAA